MWVMGNGEKKEAKSIVIGNYTQLCQTCPSRSCFPTQLNLHYVIKIVGLCYHPSLYTKNIDHFKVPKLDEYLVNKNTQCQVEGRSSIQPSSATKIS